MTSLCAGLDGHNAPLNAPMEGMMERRIADIYVGSAYAGYRMYPLERNASTGVYTVTTEPRSERPASSKRKNAVHLLVVNAMLQEQLNTRGLPITARAYPVEASTEEQQAINDAIAEGLHLCKLLMHTQWEGVCQDARDTALSALAGRVALLLMHG